MKVLSRIFATAFILLAALLLVAAPSRPAVPGWQSVPERLKKAAGVESREGYVYATGSAKVLNIRPDKAHEIARKKSLLHALQLLRVAFSCRELLESVGPEEEAQLFEILMTLVPPVHVAGASVIRQWEKGPENFTTITVPQSALKDVSCDIPNLATAISRYVRLEDVTAEGLAFCLRHTPRYSQTARDIQRSIGLYYMDQNRKNLARCFLEDHEEPLRISSFALLGIQNRLARASQINLLAEKADRERKWDRAIDLASQSLEIFPTYGKAYLVLSDYFLEAEKKPSLALCAAEKGLRDGTCIKEGLEETIACLKALKSSEAQVYRFLYSQLAEDAGLAWPRPWEHETARLRDTLVPYLVLASFGQAVEGESGSPDPEFSRAAALFSQARSDQDVANVLDVLLNACEKQPASAETYNLIGACYRHLEKPAVALPFLWAALRIKPDYDYALTNLGLCCQQLGLKQAADYYFGYNAVKNSSSSWVKESYAKFHEERQ